MMVTDHELGIIRGHLLNDGVSKVSLQDDLVDHFCCVVEEQMEEGVEFEQAFESARGRISPDGAKEIEDDLNYLLTIKKKIMVRKVVYFLGFIALFDVMLGIALQIPGIIDKEVGNMLIMAGILTFMISVAPFLFYHFYKKSVNQLQES